MLAPRCPRAAFRTGVGYLISHWTFTFAVLNSCMSDTCTSTLGRWVHRPVAILAPQQRGVIKHANSQVGMSHYRPHRIVRYAHHRRLCGEEGRGQPFPCALGGGSFAGFRLSKPRPMIILAEEHGLQVVPCLIQNTACFFVFGSKAGRCQCLCKTIISVKEARMELSDNLEEMDVRVCVTLCTVLNYTRLVRPSSAFLRE